MTTKEVSPAVREMARKAQTDWDCSDEQDISGAEYGYLRARADVEATVQSMYDRNTSSEQRTVIGAVLYEIRNPPAPLHPAVGNALNELRGLAVLARCEGRTKRADLADAASDALEAAAREEGWVSK